METAIEFLCRPDERSTTKGDEGRRLVKLGEFEYRVVNGAKYRAIRDEEERRRQSREAQRRLRARGANTLKKRIFPPAGTPAAEAAAQKWAEIEAREPNELPLATNPSSVSGASKSARRPTNPDISQFSNVTLP